MIVLFSQKTLLTKFQEIEILWPKISINLIKNLIFILFILKNLIIYHNFIFLNRFASYVSTWLNIYVCVF